MTKLILNFALKIKGGGRERGTCEVLQPCHHTPQPSKKNKIRCASDTENMDFSSNHVFLHLLWKKVSLLKSRKIKRKGQMQIKS